VWHDAPVLEGEGPTVGGDDHLSSGEVRAIAVDDIAMRDHDGLHLQEGCSGFSPCDDQEKQKRRIRAPQRGLTRLDSLR
jgi:hypothetical protein